MGGKARKEREREGKRLRCRSLRRLILYGFCARNRHGSLRYLFSHETHSVAAINKNSNTVPNKLRLMFNYNSSQSYYSQMFFSFSTLALKSRRSVSEKNWYKNPILFWSRLNFKLTSIMYKNRSFCSLHAIKKIFSLIIVENTMFHSVQRTHFYWKYASTIMN